MNNRKIVLFGGTFDPIHLGHTSVAACALEQIGAEKIIFIPAKRSPLKSCFPFASDADRFSMTAIAAKENTSFEVSDYELKGSDPSYTLQTVKHFMQESGESTLIYWLIGADGIIELAHWYGIEELIDMCQLSVMYRAGCDEPDFTPLTATLGPKRVQKLHDNIIKTPLIDISSTEIRRRLAEGLDVKDMLNPAVEEHIRIHGLYK
ncbi:MAG: nicotinate (nicotinamide) nucleotide adenylyltransferase [Planctomycetota bacterium]|jgi:nicotinate-nucleotide adenylyltransferase